MIQKENNHISYSPPITEGAIRLKGFICPRNDKKVTLKDCINCPNECMPVPILATLLNDRPVKEGEYHVTELQQPRQSDYLCRNFDYYMPPNSMVDSMLGTAWHNAVANRLMQDDFDKLFAHNYEYEQTFRVVFDFATLVGTSDLYRIDRKILWDYKTAQVYSVKMFLKNGWNDPTWDKHRKQLNIYKVYQYPQTECLRLHIKVMGWDRLVAQELGKDKTFIRNVPILEPTEVKDYVMQRLKENIADQQSGTPPPCEKEDMWFNSKGEPMRCLYYCGGKEHCKQFQQLMEEY